MQLATDTVVFIYQQIKITKDRQNNKMFQSWFVDKINKKK